MNEKTNTYSRKIWKYKLMINKLNMEPSEALV